MNYDLLFDYKYVILYLKLYYKHIYLIRNCIFLFKTKTKFLFTFSLFWNLFLYFRKLLISTINGIKHRIFLIEWTVWTLLEKFIFNFGIANTAWGNLINFLHFNKYFSLSRIYFILWHRSKALNPKFFLPKIDKSKLQFYFSV